MEGDLKEIVSAFPCQPGVRLLLSGELGSGKTTFSRHWLERWGAEPEFQGSPTFAYHHRYRAEFETDRVEIDHFDLYRIRNDSEVESLGLLEFLEDPSRAALVEWPEKLGSFQLKGLQVIRLNFSILEDGRHHLKMN